MFYKGHIATIKRYISELPDKVTYLSIVTIPLLGFFLYKKRLLYFFKDISLAIKGNGNSMSLLLDGLTLILSILLLYQLTSAYKEFMVVKPMKMNHPAIQEILLPSYINEAYLTEDEQILQRKEQRQHEKFNEGLAKDGISEQVAKIAEITGYIPNLESTFGPITRTTVELDEKVEAMKAGEAEAQSLYAKHIASMMSSGPITQPIEIHEVDTIDEVLTYVREINTN